MDLAAAGEYTPVLPRLCRVTGALRATFLTIALLAMPPFPAPAQPARVLQHFQSGGKDIRVETFGNESRQATPSVIVLHGATGVEYANRFIAHLAESIAAEGFVVHLVHYFDRTGSSYADDVTIKRSSSDWQQTVHDATTFVREQRPGSVLGLFGYSLGGYLAAAETIRNRDIGAAVILAGGLDESTAGVARHHPPVLILHGGDDTRVPFSEAQRLKTTLERLGGHPAVHIYPGEGHIMSLPAYADVVRRTGEFFRSQLKPKVP